MTDAKMPSLIHPLMWLAFSVERGKDAADTKVKRPGLLTQYPSRTEPAESIGVDGH
jgi:hypothetical protein